MHWAYLYRYAQDPVRRPRLPAFAYGLSHDLLVACKFLVDEPTNPISVLAYAFKLSFAQLRGALVNQELTHPSVESLR